MADRPRLALSAALTVFGGALAIILFLPSRGGDRSQPGAWLTSPGRSSDPPFSGDADGSQTRRRWNEDPEVRALQEAIIDADERRDHRTYDELLERLRATAEGNDWKYDAFAKFYYSLRARRGEELRAAMKDLRAGTVVKSFDQAKLIQQFREAREDHEAVMAYTALVHTELSEESYTAVMEMFQTSGNPLARKYALILLGRQTRTSADWMIDILRGSSDRDTQAAAAEGLRVKPLEPRHIEAITALLPSLESEAAGILVQGALRARGPASAELARTLAETGRDAAVREAAVRRLDPRVEADLGVLRRATTTDPILAVRLAAVSALGSGIGEREPENLLVATLSTSELPEVRRAAAQILGSHFLSQREKIASVLSSAARNDPDEGVREAAASSLAAIRQRE